MKTNGMLFRTMLALTSTLTILGCRGLPEEYQGAFSDRANGVKLTLSSSSAQIEMRGGRKIDEDGQEITYENLVKGIGGLYVKPAVGNVSDVYYIKPQNGTKQVEGGIVWYQAELIYTQMETNRRSPVKELKLVRCAAGNVMIDKATQRWQIGCPAGATTYALKRIADREVFNPFGF